MAARDSIIEIVGNREVRPAVSNNGLISITSKPTITLFESEQMGNLSKMGVRALGRFACFWLMPSSAPHNCMKCNGYNQFHIHSLVKVALTALRIIPDLD